MSVIDLIMPKLGESIMEATILKWHKNIGDLVQQDETVLDIATDKVDSEVPSTDEGILTEILFKVNDVVPVGAVFARLSTGVTGNIGQSAGNLDEPAAMAQEAIPYQPSNLPPAGANKAAGSKSMIRFYSPLVLKIAQEEGVSMSQLEAIPGTGQDGRVSKKDMMDYLVQAAGSIAIDSATPERNAPHPVSESQLSVQTQPPATKQAAAEPGNTQLAISNYGPNVEIVEMDRMRKLIAKFMVDSKQISPHVTSFTEADVTNMVMWRERVKKDFEKRENTKITFTPLFIEAVVRCIKRFPLINCSIDGDKIIIKKDINIGMATALPSGNLIVPVIKHADQLNLVGLSKQVNGLAEAARNHKLKPDDTQGGTFTLTNVGTFGSLMGTPIINQPQVAILAVGAIKKRPVVIETPQGDTIGIRHMMYLSMSYDHRIVDGSLGATFLSAVAKELEAWNPERGF
ncbi:MAG: dihydrolipoamide acetyltransferase family protein [Chitinophagaceae bacterium]